MISYSFIHINEDIDDNKNEISQNFNESKIIIINQNSQSDTNSDELYFFISFQKTIIIIKQTSIAFLKSLFSKSKELKICFLSDTKENFEKNIKIQYQEIENNEIFQSEMSFFNTELKYKKPAGISFKEVWSLIQPCISGYLIKQSYEKLNKNRIDDFFLKRKKQKILITNLDKEDYITIRHLGSGSIFMTSLVYHIEKEELFVIKKPYVIDDEIPKLSKRELLNYSSIQHPFLPEFYGTTKENYLVIEFINGSTLEFIEKKHLNFNEKIVIIFEIIITVLYLHKKNYIFRDLKPNNIMIDQNKTVVLIDFDRMIRFNYTSECSVKFEHEYAAPEIKSGKKATDKCDTYSIGKMIKFIFTENQNDIHNMPNNLDKSIKKICDICIQKEPEKRASVSILIYLFFTIFYSYLQNCQILDGHKEYYDFFEIEMMNNIKYTLDNPDDPDVLNALGLCYLKGAKTDVEYAINCLNIAATKGNTKAQYNLGVIYEANIHVQRDIYKAINYFTLAAKKNHCESQYRLGVIYFNGEYIQKDINKGIQYLIQSANQNHPGAQFNLGFYYEGYIHDIKKALNYYNLSASQNYPNALTKLLFFRTIC